MQRNTISAAKAAEQQAGALYAQAKEAAKKGGAKAKALAKSLQDAADSTLAKAERYAQSFPTLARGHQMAIALVNAAVRPGSNHALASRIADSARSIANQA